MKMRREIKFRAWDSVREKMYEWEGTGLGQARPHWVDKETPVMQFTGLKDKNKKEIYEGDVVKTLFRGEEDTVIGEIIWADAGFFIGYKEFKDDLFAWAFYKTVEVIGNIYENPELTSPETKRKVK